MGNKTVPVYFEKVLELQSKLDDFQKEVFFENVEQSLKEQEKTSSTYFSQEKEAAKEREYISSYSNLQTGSSVFSATLSLASLPFLMHRPYLFMGVLATSLGSIVSEFLTRTQWVESFCKKFFPNSPNVSSYLRASLAIFPLASSSLSFASLPPLLRSDPKGFFEAMKKFLSSVSVITSSAKLIHKSQLDSLKASQKEHKTHLELMARDYDDASKNLVTQATHELTHLQNQRFCFSTYLEAERTTNQPV